MKKTPLYDRHVALGAKVIDFGGWAMPVQYTSVIEEHQTSRTKAGIFDICHMGEIEITGRQSFDLLQRVMSRNLERQENGQVMLSVMTDQKGGIIDDLTVYKFNEEQFMVVTNAATKEYDLKWIESQGAAAGFSDLQIKDITDGTGKLDIQGPLALEILQPLTSAALQPMKFYHFIRTSVLNVPAVISRTGYTGEDGFEIYVDSAKVAEIWDRLLDHGRPQGLTPVGLGARDTLRLESGMLLYGHDMCKTVTPYEVIYGWLVDINKDFIGCQALKVQKEKGIQNKLVGFELTGRGIAREGYPVILADRNIGKVTSGTFSPTLNKAIGFAFIESEFKEPGTEFEIQIRQNRVKAKVVKLPFYKSEK